MAEIPPRYPGISVDLDDCAPGAWHQNCVRVRIETLVPNELMAKTEFIGDLFKEMFDGRP